MMRALKLGFCLVLVVLFVGGSSAQQPTPEIVIQSATAPTTAAPAQTSAATAAAASVTVDAAIKLLEQTKAANDETLKKQEALMQQLDEVQKAAEQLKVFAKRV
jgi:hypothetical protein